MSGTIHASCVAIAGKGVLLLGPSGAGKSDLALRLIDGGARLVADDRTQLTVKGDALWASAPAAIRGLIEIRGVGIVALPPLAGARIHLVVRLGAEGARLPPGRFYRPPAGLKPASPPPEIALNPYFASAPAKIRAALAAFARRGFRDTFNVK